MFSYAVLSHIFEFVQRETLMNVINVEHVGKNESLGVFVPNFQSRCPADKLQSACIALLLYYELT